MRASPANPQRVATRFCMPGEILQLSPFPDEAPRTASGCRVPASPRKSFLAGSSLPEEMLLFPRLREGDASLFASQESAMPSW